MIVYVCLWAISLCVVSSTPVQIEVSFRGSSEMMNFTPSKSGYVTYYHIWMEIAKNYRHVSEVLLLDSRAISPDSVLLILDPRINSVIELQKHYKLIVFDPDSIGVQKKKVSAKKGSEVKQLDLGKFVEKSYLLEKVQAAFPGAKKITVHTEVEHSQYFKEDTVVTKETQGIKFFQVDQIQGIIVE